MKIYDDQWRWKQEKEIYVYQLLQQHGVGPVPAVLHHGDADNALGRCHTVMTMLRGQPLSAVGHALDRASLREIYRQIGGCMAAWLQSTRSRRAPTDTSPRGFWIPSRRTPPI
ncbi:phosphotransferase [Streptomyces sp. NPDC020794]|uniref:phosphotransferase n=1 Tax=unclassified Streptomyces TaxID=2593676 RepID=UPI0036E39994